MNASLTQLLNGNLEMITLAVVLFVLSKMVLEALNIGVWGQVKDWGKRIPPEKASLSGQRRVRRA